jgi:hypothetical protein
LLEHTCAEGSLHHGWVPLHEGLQAVEAAGVPLWLMNAAFQYDMATPLGNSQTPGIFQDAAHAALRDGSSYAALRSALPWAEHVQLAADLTLLLPHSFGPAAAEQLRRGALTSRSRQGEGSRGSSAESPAAADEAAGEAASGGSGTGGSSSSKANGGGRADQPGRPLTVVLSRSTLNLGDFLGFWPQLIAHVLDRHPNSTFLLSLDFDIRDKARFDAAH